MRNSLYTLEDFDFELPQELIAQEPSSRRDAARLFVLDRKNGAYIHSSISELPSFLRCGDVLVFNDAKVIRARIPCRRKSGARFELLLSRRIDNHRWAAIANRTKRLKQGETVISAGDNPIELKIVRRTGDTLEIETGEILTDEILSAIGDIALPPYIKRDVSDQDRERYQTVYARRGSAVAAPTAGLHFTSELFDEIIKKGARTVFLTLDVSWGTFQPVRAHDIKTHRIQTEGYSLSEETAESINSARKTGNRIIAVGTTTLRVLESTYHDGKNVPGDGETDLFIYPPRKILSVGSLITNFHTPRSTLLMLVAAFVGYETIMDAYRDAVDKKYRFFSYGDAMLIV